MHTLRTLLILTHNKILVGAMEILHREKFSSRERGHITGSFLGEETGNAYGVVLVLRW